MAGVSSRLAREVDLEALVHGYIMALVSGICINPVDRGTNRALDRSNDRFERVCPS